MSRQVIDVESAIFARSAGLRNTDTPPYRTSCVLEMPFTLVRRCRTFAALDHEGVVIGRGILEPGGDMDGLVADLRSILALIDGPLSVASGPALALVPD